MAWEIALELKLYAVYLREYIGLRQNKKHFGKHGHPNQEVRRCKGYIRHEVCRDERGYGRDSV